MDKGLSRTIFGADFTGAKALTGSYRLKNASEIGFKEDWLQSAIAENIELVLGPCREGGFIPQEEEWRFWGREVAIKGAGGISIDVLLVSEFGRLGIIETKLFHNPEARRAVVVQAIEYAIHLSISDLPSEAPRTSEGQPFVELDDVQEKINEPLIVIAGDLLDPRAVKLSNAVLGKHVGNGWDLALVELSTFEQQTTSSPKQFLLVPHLVGGIAVEQRQVLLVRIEDNRTQVEVQEPKAGSVVVNRANKWDEERFFAAAERAAAPLRDFARQLRRIRDSHAGVAFSFGSSKDGSLIFRKNGTNLMEFYLGYRGYIRFRRSNDAGEDNFANALGEQLGRSYRERLESLFPRGMAMSYPTVNFEVDGAAKVLDLLGEVLKASDSGNLPLKS
jgi:hypothetical protein